MRRALPFAVVLALAAAGCRNDMHRQYRIKPFRGSALFADGSSARPLPPGTVPRGFLRDNRAFWAGQGPDGKFVAEVPMPVTKALLDRGKERFNIYCSPCHGRTGLGQGMVVQRGFKQPTSFHIDRLRNERIGYLFDVATNGFGQMSGYASQIPPEDRWAIAAWIRVLQLSQNAPVAMLTSKDREQLEAKSGNPTKPASETQHESAAGVVPPDSPSKKSPVVPVSSGSPPKQKSP
jgi:mono/diheme cytochrome c family protein